MADKVAAPEVVVASAVGVAEALALSDAVALALVSAVTLTLDEGDCVEAAVVVLLARPLMVVLAVGVPLGLVDAV